MLGTTKAVSLQQMAALPQVREKPFIIPSPQKDEVAESYITAVKANAPMENFTLGGINFEKAVFPSDASLVKNIGKKLFFPRLLCKMMTKSQAEAILAEAAKRTIYIRMIQNPKFEAGSDNGQPQYLPGGEFRMSEWIILEAEKGFDQRKYPTADAPWQSPALQEGTAEDVKTNLLELQRQSNSSVKAKK